MSAQGQLSRIRLRWTPRRVALEIIYRLDKRQLDAALVASLFARMKRDIYSRFHPDQASLEYAGAVKHVLFLFRIYAAAMGPLLDAMSAGAQRLTFVLPQIDFGQVGSPGSQGLVDAHNRLRVLACRHAN